MSIENGPVYCADCHARGVETQMVPDADFDGHLCPACEPIDAKMIGRRDDRLARYDRLRTTLAADRDAVAKLLAPTPTPRPVAAEQTTPGTGDAS